MGTITPLLANPLPVQHSLIQSMEIDDVFNLSMSGTAARKAIQRMDWEIVGTMMDVHKCVGKTTIIGRSASVTNKEARWELLANHQGDFLPMMKINSTIFNIAQFDPAAAANAASWSKDDFRRWFVSESLPYFGVLFGPLHRIGTSMMLNELRLLRNRAIIRICVIEDRHAHARQVTDFCNRFHGRSLILRMTIQGTIEVSSSMMRIPHLYVEDARWFTGAHLLEFGGKNIFAFNTSIYTNDAVQFINQWLNGRNMRFRSVVLSLTNGIPFDPKDVMRSFPNARGWNPEERERFYIYKEWWKMHFLLPHMDLLDCSTGMDITRESDDMMATIRMTKTAFCFFVWHRRFPNALRGN